MMDVSHVQRYWPVYVFHVSKSIKTHFSLSLLIGFPTCLFTPLLHLCDSLMCFYTFKKKKEKVCLIEGFCVPPGKCAQTLVLGVMLSVLMEVQLPLDSFVFLSFLSVLLRHLFIPKDGTIESTDRVRNRAEMDREVNGFSLPQSPPPPLSSQSTISRPHDRSSCCLTVIGAERCVSA